MHYSFFPPALIALNEEVTNHPNLQNQLGNNPNADTTDKLTIIATYCNVVLDGYYDEQKQLGLCELLVSRLREMRSEIIS